MSVMIGSVTERLAPDSNFMMFDNLTNSSVVDLASRDAQRVRVAAAVTCLSGLFQVCGPVVPITCEFWCCFKMLFCHLLCVQVLLGLLQLGFLVTYLSEPLVRGYTTGAAIHVIVSQLKYTFGINPKRHNGPLSLIYVRQNAAVTCCFAACYVKIPIVWILVLCQTILEVCYLVPKTNIGTLVVSIVAIVCLLVAKELNACLSKKIPVPIPVELLAVSTAALGYPI